MPSQKQGMPDMSSCSTWGTALVYEDMNERFGARLFQREFRSGRGELLEGVSGGQRLARSRWPQTLGGSDDAHADGPGLLAV